MFEGIAIFIAATALSLSLILGVRWRRQKNLLLREVTKSQQNIMLGIMLLANAAFIFLNYTSFDYKLIIAIVFIIFGLINFVIGIKMYRHYKKQVNALQQ